MLVERLERDDVPVWLVNTGWTGGPYGVGQRMNIAHTRSMVRAALDGALDDVPTRPDPNFGVAVPTELPGRARPTFLDPRATWADPDAYDAAAARLGGDVPRELRDLRRRGRRRDRRGRSWRGLTVDHGQRQVGPSGGPDEQDDPDDERPDAQRQRDREQDQEKTEQGDGRRGHDGDSSDGVVVP